MLQVAVLAQCARGVGGWGGGELGREKAYRCSRLLVPKLICGAVALHDATCGPTDSESE